MTPDPETVGILQDSPGSLLVVFGALETYALSSVRTVTEDMGGQFGVQVEREYLAIATGALPGLQRGSMLSIRPADDPAAESESRRVLYQRRKDDDPGLCHVFVEEV